MVDVRSRGFTLIELMVVVMVVVILGMIAAPSFTTMIKTSRIKGAASSLHMALLKARSEALKRNNSVRVSAAGGNWGSGWSVVLVSDGTVLSTHAIPANSVSITSAPNTASVTYLRSGRVSNNQTVFTVDALPPFEVPSHKKDRCRSVTLGVNGMPSVRPMDCPP